MRVGLWILGKELGFIVFYDREFLEFKFKNSLDFRNYKFILIYGIRCINTNNLEYFDVLKENKINYRNVYCN